MVDLTIRGISDFFFLKYGSGFNKCANNFNSPNRFTKILALSPSLGLQGWIPGPQKQVLFIFLISTDISLKFRQFLSKL